MPGARLIGALVNPAKLFDAVFPMLESGDSELILRVVSWHHSPASAGLLFRPHARLAPSVASGGQAVAQQC
jgi:hypothetical protein